MAHYFGSRVRACDTVPLSMQATKKATKKATTKATAGPATTAKKIVSKGGTTKSTKKTTTKKDVSKRETPNGAKSTKSAASHSVRFSGTKELVGWEEFCQWECPAGLGAFKCKLRCDLSEGKALSTAASPLQLIKKTQGKRWLGTGVPVEETTKVVKTFSEVKDTISSFFQDLTADSLDEVMARLDNVDDDLEFSLPLAEADIICLGGKQLSTGSLDELLRLEEDDRAAVRAARKFGKTHPGDVLDVCA